MADEPKTEPTNDKAISALQEQVSTLTKTMEQQQQFLVANLEKLTNTVTTREKPAPKPKSDGWDDFDPDLGARVKQTVKEATDNVEEKVDKKVDQKLQYSKQEEYYANLLTKEFPQVLDPNHELHKEFMRLKAKKVEANPDYFKSPDAVYELTNSAYSNLVRKGVIVPDGFQDEVQRMLSINDSTTPGFRQKSDPQKAEDLTPSQLHFASAFKVPVDRYIKELRSSSAKPKGVQ